MTLATKLSNATLEKIQQRFRMQEIGSPYLTLTSAMSPAPIGSLRLFSGALVRKMVYIGMSVPPINLDSHMIFAFTALDSTTPHFTLDSVCNGDTYAFHLDLIPRVDLAANLAYTNAAYQPLTIEFERARKIEGLTPAHISPRQYALMSPWMLVYRATESAFEQIDDSVNFYLEHWTKLVELGVPAQPVLGHEAETLAQRDRLNRQAIFSPEVDPVWAQVERLVGAETGQRLRDILMNQEIEG